MVHNRRWSLAGMAVLAALAAVQPQPALAQGSAAPRTAKDPGQDKGQGKDPVQATFTVRPRQIEDLKAVFATVRSRDRIEARVRIAGTVTQLLTDEGDQVAAGVELALVADPKISLQIDSLEAQIVGARSRLAAAQADLERAAELLRRGVASQARYDQLKAAADSADNELKALEAQRSVLVRQIEEGKVLAPAAGRVLKVPVTVGSVVLPGESIATIAANAYLLRIELPERHARFIKEGDPIRLAGSSLAPDGTAEGKGRIVQVYPELANGRVIADAEAEGLGNFFIAERVRVLISVGKRETIVVPQNYVFKRAGIDYVHVQQHGGPPLDVVVQPGNPAPLDGDVAGVEILAGLQPGDALVAP